ADAGPTFNQQGVPMVPTSNSATSDLHVEPVSSTLSEDVPRQAEPADEKTLSEQDAAALEYDSWFRLIG
ncbi:MAG TPA: hypothetical protein VJ608_11730, partial [Albitalea sp.]|nr:hypothetical protein [Albitalea sp.]